MKSVMRLILCSLFFLPLWGEPLTGMKVEPQTWIYARLFLAAQRWSGGTAEVSKCPITLDEAPQEAMDELLEANPDIPKVLIVRWKELAKSKRLLNLSNPNFVQAIEQQALRMGCVAKVTPPVSALDGKNSANILRLSRVARFEDQALLLYSWRDKGDVRFYHFDYYRFHDFSVAAGDQDGRGVWLEVKPGRLSK